ncbi:MAG: TolC family protein [Verrucomicrobiales bacterium]|nr:TolC family protein [Verrucomicrobiales bacterium]
MKHGVSLSRGRSWLVAAWVVAGALGSGHAREAGQADPTALSLEEAVRLALLTNPSLRAAGGRVEAASGRAFQAGRWSNPELELSAEDWPVSGGGSFDDSKQTIGIVQTLPFPGKKPLDRRAGGMEVRLSEAQLALRRTEIVRDVKAAYARVLAYERLAAVSAELAEVAESTAATARKRVEHGAAPLQEQLRAEVQSEQTRTGLIAQQRDLATARLDLATLLGRPELREVPLSGALREVPDSGLLTAAVPPQLADHPSTVAARANLERARLEQRRARLEAYPDVQVGLAGGRIGETGESIIQLGISLPLPILDRGRGRRREAAADIDVAEAELQSVQQQLQREWMGARERYRAAAAAVTAHRERILPRADEALRLVRTGFEEGKFTFIDLADTQRTQAEARLAYQYSLLELNVAQAEVEALLRPRLPSPSPAPSTSNSE